MDEKIKKAIKPLLEMYEKIENDLLVKLANHFSINEEFLNSDHWRIKKLEELGLFNQEVVNYLAKYAKKTNKEVLKALNQIGIDMININKLKRLFQDEVIKINPNILINNYTINNMINYAYNELSNRFIEMSSKIETSARNAYLDIVEQTYLKTTMGTHSYQQAIREAINDLSNKGIKTLTYTTTNESGNITGIRNYDIESAVRRETLTAARQLSGNINLEVANKLECEYLYLSEHLRCRRSHFDWQGTIIKRKDFVNITNYGAIDGIYGINCAHYAEPYWGDAKGDDLKKYSKKECLNAYNMSQKQRYLERGIRQWKRKAEMFKASDDKELNRKSIIKVNEWQQRIREFTGYNGLKRDYTREYVSGYREVKINLKPSKYVIDTLSSAGIKADDSLSKMDGKLLRRNVNQIKNIANKYDMKDFFETYNVPYVCLNRTSVASVGYDKTTMNILYINSSQKYFKDKNTLLNNMDECIATNWCMPFNEKNKDIYAMTHEMGHALEIKMFKKQYPLGNKDL